MHEFQEKHATDPDGGDYYEVKEIGDTLFRKAVSTANTVFLLGNHVIAKTTTAEEEAKIEEELATSYSGTMIPIISVVVESILRDVYGIKAEEIKQVIKDHYNVQEQLNKIVE